VLGLALAFRQQLSVSHAAVLLPCCTCPLVDEVAKEPRLKGKILIACSFVNSLSN